MVESSQLQLRLSRASSQFLWPGHQYGAAQPLQPAVRIDLLAGVARPRRLGVPVRLRPRRRRPLFAPPVARPAGPDRLRRRRRPVRRPSVGARRTGLWPRGRAGHRPDDRSR